MAHQPDDIVSRRHVIFCRKRPMMHRRNDIMHRTADMGYRRNVIMHRTADIGYRRNDITHRPEDIGERRYDIICRMRPMMHRRNDIMHRTADIGYRTNHIIHQMNDIGIRRLVIKKVGIFILLTPPSKQRHKRNDNEATGNEAGDETFHTPKGTKSAYKKRPPQIICDGPFLIKKILKPVSGRKTETCILYRCFIIRVFAVFRINFQQT